MIFTETALPGAFIIDLEPRQDDRGFFARSFCQREFAAHGLNTDMVQASISYTRRKGVMRGLHFQYPPHFEAKLVRCIRGAIFDVFVDLRPESPTYLRHVSVELTEANQRAVYVPARFAHAHQVLEDDSVTLYQVSGFYTPEAESGLSYADPRLAIDWPLEPIEVSDKDRTWPLLGVVEPHIRARMTVPVPADVR